MKPPNAGTPARRAAALSYDPFSRGQASRASAAPRLVAKGQGLIAEAIIERARAAGVAIHESRELVAALMQLDLDREIPPALYVAVAEVLVWVYRLEQREQHEQHRHKDTRAAAAGGADVESD